MVRGNVTFTGSIQKQLQLRLESWLSNKTIEDVRTQFLTLTGSLPTGDAETMRSDSSLAPVFDCSNATSFVMMMRFTYLGQEKPMQV